MGVASKIARQLTKKIRVYQGRSKKGTKDFMNPTDFYGDESVSFGTTDLNTADQFAMKQTVTYPYRAKDGSEGPTKKTLIPGDVAELEFDIKNPMVVNRKSVGFSRDNEKAMIAEAKEKGHDGVKIIYDGSDKIDYVAFNKKQVKVTNKSLYPEREYPYSPTSAELAELSSDNKFNKGGVNMKKQMEMFDEGGLEQDGGTVDPVSGNDVPVGSTQEEVRDDIPAQLSEGEFVFPADVVRFIGLNNLMQIRQEAKAGLKKMEAMGQMGNSDEATMPDDIPFTADDITVEDDDGNEGELEMNVGGVVYQPSQVGSQFNIAPQQQQPVFQPMPMPQQQTGYVPSFGMQPQQPQQYTGFQSLIPMPTQKYENVSYINKTTGETMVIPHVGGKPVFNPPEGFTRIKAGEEPKPKEDTKVDETLDTSVPTATVTKPYDKEGDSTSPENMRKAEEERNRSYENMVESAIKQSGISNPSLEDVTKFIKDGNVKANLFGFEFGIPGLTFREEDIEKAYKKKIGLAEDTATGKFSGSDQIDRVGPDLKTTFTSAFKKKEDEDKDADATEELKETLSKLDATYKRQQEIDKEKADALFAQQEAAAKKYLQQLENKRAEAEENRKKAREEAIAAKAEQRDRAIRESEDRFVRETGMRRAKGGIASKPKKKTMKRGGLASKK